MADLHSEDGELDSGGLVRRAVADPVHSPLGAYLRDNLDEERALGMWRRVDARLARPEPPARAHWFVLAAAALLVVSFLALRRAPTQALDLATGSAPVLLEGAGDGRHQFADGSSIALGKDGRLEVLRNDEQVFMSALRRGSGTFDVRAGARKWVVEAGLASIEVNGARFTVSRTAGVVRIDAERGPVVVRAESLPGGSRRLEAGEKLEITSAALRPEASPQAPEPKPEPSSLPPLHVEELRLASPLRKPAASANTLAKPPEAVPLVAPVPQAQSETKEEAPRQSEPSGGTLQPLPRDLGDDWQAEQVSGERRAGERPIPVELREKDLRRPPSGIPSGSLKIRRAP